MAQHQESATGRHPDDRVEPSIEACRARSGGGKHDPVPHVPSTFTGTQDEDVPGMGIGAGLGGATPAWGIFFADPGQWQRCWQL